MGKGAEDRAARPKAQTVKTPEGPLMFFMRAWLWLVPIILLVASAVFAVIAAVEGEWALLAVMVVIGIFAIGLLIFHWWVMYGFGKQAQANKKPGE